MPFTITRNPASGTAPSWVSSLPWNGSQGTWTTLTNDGARSSLMSQAPAGIYYASNASDVIWSWSGAAFAKTFGPFGSMIHWGGGHNGYWGNEVYRYDLDTLGWYRLNSPVSNPSGYWPLGSGLFPANLPTGTNPNTGGNWNPLGSPGPTHSAYHLLWDGSRGGNGDFWTTTREYDVQGGRTYWAPARFNLNTMNWDYMGATITTISGTSMDNSGGEDFDPSRLCIYCDSVNSSFGLPWGIHTYYLPNSSAGTPNTWRYVAGSGANHGTGGGRIASQLQYSPDLDCIVLRVFSDQGPTTWMVYDPDNLGSPIVITPSGTGPTAGAGLYSSISWSSNLGAFLFILSSTNTIYKLTPPLSGGPFQANGWSWSTISAIGTILWEPGYGADPIINGRAYRKQRAIDFGSTTIFISNLNPNGPGQAVRLS